MKRWSLDARSRRRRPQALCVRGERGIREPLALRRASGDVRGYLAQGRPLKSPQLIGKNLPVLAGFMEQDLPDSILSS